MAEPTVQVPVSLIERIRRTYSVMNLGPNIVDALDALLSQPTPTAEPPLVDLAVDDVVIATVPDPYPEGRYGGPSVQSDILAQNSAPPSIEPVEQSFSMDDERRMVLKRLQRLNLQAVSLGNPLYSTDVLKAVCDVLEGRTETPKPPVTSAESKAQRKALTAVIRTARETFYSGTTNYGMSYDRFVAEWVQTYLRDRTETPDEHHLGRVHGGMRWCTDRGCNWGRTAREGER